MYTDTPVRIAEAVMAFHIKNPETDALARRVAALKKVGLTEAVHGALAHELEREREKPSEIEAWIKFARDFRVKGNPEKALPADKDFIDSLYED
jgi:antitoxin VapB